MKQTIFVSLALLFLSVSACSTREEKEINEVQSVSIKWLEDTTQKIALKGGYPRMIKTNNGSLLVAYENYLGDIESKFSFDDGQTWSDSKTVFKHFMHQNVVVKMSNPELILLADGGILMACNYRPSKDEAYPYSIVLRRSTDQGNTWGPIISLYKGEPRFRDGCWEPSFLQLPSGEIQVYFANEGKYLASNEQEIAIIRSLDGGITWSEHPEQVSFRDKRRDGMPVPTVVNDEILLVIEDNKQGEFKPYILKNRLIDNWKSPVLGDTNNRYYALQEKFEDSVYIGAPYILALPNGCLAISYQTSYNRGSDWELSTMEVATASSATERFTNRSNPFDIPANRHGKWNSIMLLNDSIIIALTSSNLDGKEVAPWMVKGKIIFNNSK